MKNILYLIVCFIVLFSCKSNESTNSNNGPKSKLFTLITPEESGIKFRNDLEEDATDDRKNVMSFEYFYHGGGVAIADFNNDDLSDIIFTSNQKDNKLYINNGDFKFEDVTDQAQINQKKYWSTGVTTVDINQDGWMDIYICQSGPFEDPESQKANLLYINNGDLTFTESAAEYGLDDKNLSTQASFFDFDNDGDLDCVVMNESKYIFITHSEILKDIEDKDNLRKASSQLYENVDGKFVNITEKAGMLNWGYGLGLVTTDINDDGFVDIYIANDYSVPDFLYINQKDGTFKDEIKKYTNQIPFYSMGIDAADINNDGLIDISVVDMAADDHVRDKTLMAGMNTELFWYYINKRNFHYQYMFNSLQLNNGNNTFSNIANLSGLSRTDWSWSTLLADFDNDGYKDYFVSNGIRRYVRDNDFRNEMAKFREKHGGSVPDQYKQEWYDKMPSIKLENKIYQNNKDLQFEYKTTEWGLNQPSFSNGAAYADLDNDGDLDLVVNNVQDFAFVYKNNTSNNFIQFGFESAFPIENTKIKITTSKGIQTNELTRTRGYLSAINDIIHFGLDKEEEIKNVEIRWPDGKISELSNLEINKRHIVNHNQSKQKNKNKIKNENKTFNEELAAELGVDFVHLENPFDDFTKQVLLPQKQSQLGPAIATGDVNNDGLDDFYIGGASGQSGILYYQNNDGTFRYNSNEQVWALDKESEDVDALLYDADGDNDLDLYVVSGGNEFEKDAPQYQDRLYINMDGRFMKVKQGLPNTPFAGSCVRKGDFDNDGDFDLFVGGKAVPGQYPFASPSQLLIFENFRYVNSIELMTDLESPLGMISDAQWADINNDGKLDLITVGEWDSPRIFLNENNTLKETTSEYGLNIEKGWWFSVTVVDVDNDGDNDIVAGNLGLNSKFKASHKKPFKVFANDFDNNGSCDIILSKEYKGKDVPTRGRQCSSEQMPFIEEKFKTFNSFANASVLDIVGKKQIENSLNLKVHTFASKVFINEGSRFTPIDLPIKAQKAPILTILSEDINNDGLMDLICAGNIFETEVETPRYDAGTGLILKNVNNGRFIYEDISSTGFFTFKNAKGMKKLKGKNNWSIIVVNNNDRPQFFISKEKPLPES